MHEDLNRSGDVKLGSERQFGLVFAAVFVIVALFPLLGDGGVRLWSLGIAAAFVVVSFVYPRCLRPFNKLWFRFGLLLHRVMSPLVMGFMFFVAVTPTGFIMRTLGKDLLRLRFDKDATSYWIERTPPGPAPDTMRNQF